MSERVSKPKGIDNRIERAREFDHIAQSANREYYSKYRQLAFTERRNCRRRIDTFTERVQRKAYSSTQ